MYLDPFMCKKFHTLYNRGICCICMDTLRRNWIAIFIFLQVGILRREYIYTYYEKTRTCYAYGHVYLDIMTLVIPTIVEVQVENF